MNTYTWLNSNPRCSKFPLSPVIAFVILLDLWTTSVECASEYFTAKNQAFSAFISLIWALTQASEGVNQEPMRLRLTQVSGNSININNNYSTRTFILKSPKRKLENDRRPHPMQKCFRRTQVNLRIPLGRSFKLTKGTTSLRLPRSNQ